VSIYKVACCPADCLHSLSHRTIREETSRVKGLRKDGSKAGSSLASSSFSRFGGHSRMSQMMLGSKTNLASLSRKNLASESMKQLRSEVGVSAACMEGTNISKFQELNFHKSREIHQHE